MNSARPSGAQGYLSTPTPTPPGSPLPGSITTSLPPADALEEAEALLTKALLSLSPGDAPSEDGEEDGDCEFLAGLIAKHLQGCLRPSTLDLGCIANGLVEETPGNLASLVSELPPEAWQALDAIALARDGRRIERVYLPVQVMAGPLEPIAQGLRQYSQLREVCLSVPEGATTLDLRPLARAARPGQPLQVTLDIHGDNLHTVQSHPQLDERAGFNGITRTIHGRKCVVTYPVTDDAGDTKSTKSTKGVKDTKGGQAHKPRPLANYWYLRRATGLDDAARAARKTAEAFAADANLNARAVFTQASPDGKAASPAAKLNERIVCRHLGMTWLPRRLDSRLAKGTAQAQRFSYTPFATAQGIAALVPAQTERDYARLIARRPDVVTLGPRLGAEMARLFAEMAPGETRLFGLLTADHFMTLDLQRLRRDHGGRLRDEFIVDVFDPNRTVSHPRVSLASLDDVQGCSLQDWLPQPYWSRYFEAGEAPAIALYGYARVQGGQATLHEGVVAEPAFRLPAEWAAEPGYLYWSVMADRPAQVRESVAAMLALPAVTPEALSQRLGGRGRRQGGPVIASALWSGATAATRAYVEAVARIPAPRLGSSGHFELLAGFGRSLPALHHGVAQGHVETALAYVEAVLACPLGDIERLMLAMARDLSDRPLALALCETPPTDSDLELPAQHRFLHGYVQLILRSDRLGPHDAPLLLASAASTAAREPGTAAQRALACGNARAAGAMVCAVLEMPLPDEKREAALKALGVGVQEVCKALTQGGASGAPWLARIEAANTQGAPADGKAASTPSIMAR